MSSVRTYRAKTSINKTNRDNMLKNEFDVSYSTKFSSMNLIPFIEYLDKCCATIPKKSNIHYCLENMRVVIRFVNKKMNIGKFASYRMELLSVYNNGKQLMYSNLFPNIEKIMYLNGTGVVLDSIYGFNSKEPIVLTSIKKVTSKNGNKYYRYHAENIVEEQKKMVIDFFVMRKEKILGIYNNNNNERLERDLEKDELIENDMTPKSKKAPELKQEGEEEGEEEEGEEEENEDYKGYESLAPNFDKFVFRSNLLGEDE